MGARRRLVLISEPDPPQWSFDPDDVRMTEVAMEVCDGRPSYAEGHLDDYPTYCPWGARVVAER